MTTFVLRMRNGNCVVARQKTKQPPGSSSEISEGILRFASVRKLSSFVAQFTLTDVGDLVTTLLDRQTLSDLHSHEYPMLYAAHYHSYNDFGPSPTDVASEPLLYDAGVRTNRRDWAMRDRNKISYAVQQEGSA